jgi:hypothetical protein
VRRQIASISEDILDDMFCDPPHHVSAREHETEDLNESRNQGGEHLFYFGGEHLN